MTLVRVAPPRTLRLRSRSFYFASLLFGAERREEIATLYAFCRWLDDLVDERVDPQHAATDLEHAREALDGLRPPGREMADFLVLCRRRGIDRAHAHALIDGMASDLLPVRVADDAELLEYCFRVAGTVGLMMCRLLGAEDRAAEAHAIDLGIAMQLTNICRDVGEDAARGRVYLPAARLDRHDGSVASVVLELLELADRYYASGEAGLGYLAPRSRPGVLVAARIYRAIGSRLRAWDGDALRARAVVSTPRKVWVALSALPALLKSDLEPPEHERQLHAALDAVLIQPSSEHG
ncbi:MAG: phytoene/squalene synthase family protein [Deltaproteobacteria bacterium]